MTHNHDHNDEDDDNFADFVNDDDGDDIQFADPGGRSALRAATPDNPRDLPCPTCRRPNKLTPEDQRLGYQCDSCADRMERGQDIYDFDN